ncbi:MAG TPA: hypothetical protein VLS47_03065 [Gallionella sp.]|nr:hypothetical protein [Gallionella sp.]
MKILSADECSLYFTGMQPHHCQAQALASRPLCAGMLLKSSGVSHG